MIHGRELGVVGLDVVCPKLGLCFILGVAAGANGRVAGNEARQHTYEQNAGGVENAASKQTQVEASKHERLFNLVTVPSPRKHTSTQASKQTSKQANKQTSKQASAPEDNRWDVIPVLLALGAGLKQAVRQLATGRDGHCTARHCLSKQARGRVRHMDARSRGTSTQPKHGDGTWSQLGLAADVTEGIDLVGGGVLLRIHLQRGSRQLQATRHSVLASVIFTPRVCSLLLSPLVCLTLM